MTTLLNKILFQSKQKKTELLRTYNNCFKRFKSQSPMSSKIQSPPSQPDFGAISPWEITDSEEKKVIVINLPPAPPIAKQQQQPQLLPQQQI
ncbi:hypothetical protein G9A89_001687 [Geosiphon pyriformis]|nr:hypothetical protein G9A89_001687 [Geosiphon pyriformis]